MASTYSDLKIQLMQTGENTGTWGNVTNANLTALEEAIAESVDVSFSSADVTLTLTNSNASQSARYLRLRCTGTTGGARSLILGSGCQIEKLYLVSNGCADTITVINTTGNGIAVPAGKTMFVYNNATDVVDAVTHLTSLTLGSALPVSSGGTGSTTATFSGANITSLNANNISTGTLAVGRGGTGATTLNSEAVIIGNATGAVKFVEPGTSQNVLTSNGTAWVSQAPTGGGGGGTVTSVGTGAGTINGISITGGPITTTGTISLGGGINVSTITTGVLPILYGGTAGTTTSQARDNLGLGSMATQNSGNVNITGGSITGVSGVPTTGGSNTFTGANTFNGNDLRVGGTSGNTLTIGATNPTSNWNLFVQSQVSHPAIASYAKGAGSQGLSIAADTISGGSATYALFFYGTPSSPGPGVGSITTTNGSTVQYNTASDYRLKENVTTLAGAVSRLKQLNPVRFSWKGNPAAGTVDGFIAHEVTSVVPEAVTGEKDAVDANGVIKPQQIDVSKLVPLLTASLKEAIARIETLEAEVAALKGV